MKKFYQIVSIFMLGCFAFGQEHRVGINTEEPEVTLDIRETSLNTSPSEKVQGVSFPNFTTEQRATFTNVKLGTMIYNTTLKCLEIYTIRDGITNWYCINSSESVNLSTKIVTTTETTAKQSLMFQDSEGGEILFDKNKRGFYLKEMLQIKKVDGNTIRVRNFLPRTFRNVKVFYKNDQLQQPIHIITFEEVVALAEFEEDFDFTNANLYFKDETGNVVNVSNQVFNDQNYTILVQVDDPIFEKMKTVKHKTFIHFHDFKGNNDKSNWGTPTPRHLRAYLPALANMAYLYSSEEFKNRFINYEFPLYDDKKVPIDRPAVYEKIFNIANQKIGVVTRVEGLANSSIFGIHVRFLDGSAPGKMYYDPGHTRTRENWAHEYGHVIGFGHSSNMTYKSNGNKGHGYNEIVIKLYKEMLERGELPFSQYPYAN